MHESQNTDQRAIPTVPEPSAPPQAPEPPKPPKPPRVPRATPAQIAEGAVDRADEERQFRAWMWVTTSLLAFMLFTVSVPLAATVYGVHLLAAFGTSLLLSAAIPLAIRLPWLAIGLATAGLLTFALLSAGSDGAPWPWPVTAIIGQGALLVVLGLLAPWWQGLAAWAATMLVTAPFGFVDAGAAGNAVTGAAITALALAVAVAIAQRRVIGVELFRERAHSADEQQRRILVEERTRIARELHDVVAHGLSIIHVQATSAPYRVEGLSDGARAEFAEIATSARTAMAEMRQLLGVLRSADAAADTAPQPGLAELPALAASVERAGVPVTLELGDRLPEGGLAATAAYRIVQEALSNVVRHAPGAATHVSAEVLAGDLVVGIENDASPDAAALDVKGDGGQGLIGMRERAALLGGSIEFGEQPGGGFRVLATLPLEPDGGMA
ncbi:sensor histidine kinase [Agromyces albus]|uniref:sensor histidine kinase n=1 Tax=Agromyces albus TaxID=205332 RepID=UPI0027D9157A|nr:histidine kinase [Agromyces albus]